MTGTTTTTAAEGTTLGRPVRDTLTAQRPATDALAHITATFGHLPAAYFEVSPIHLDVLTIRLHDDLDAFEQWRAALGIPAADVNHSQRPKSTHMTLKATTTFAGATIDLIGYAPALPSFGGEQQ